MILSLGTLQKESSCPLCRFFYSMRRPSLTGETTSVYHLRKYSLGHLLNSGDFETSALYAVDPGSGTGTWTSGRDYHLIPDSLPDTNHLWFLPLSPSLDYFKPIKPSPCPKPVLKGLPVHETSVNYPLLRGWIKECEEGHWGCRAMRWNSVNALKGPTIRGIDCMTREIVALRPGHRYLALSYVWGNEPLPEGVKQVDTHVSPTALPRSVPKVVEDAMIVAREIGYRYLWVDQYCIDQQDEEDKHHQIRNMDHIYEGAYATIVAFSGKDSSCGLPGVSSVRRNTQPQFKCPQMTLLGFIPGLTRQSFESSTWMKRGWTFQESLLSRRLLIFDQDQVYFHCQYGTWAECCTPRPHMMFDRYHVPTVRHAPRGGQALRSLSPLHRRQYAGYGFHIIMGADNLLKFIELYSARHLRFQADALNALRGLLSRTDLLTYWGVPCHQLSFQYFDQFDENELYGDLALQASDEEATSLFLRCLCWVPLCTGVGIQYLGRREGFPSWSWLGWRTPVTFERLYYDSDSRTLPAVEIEDASGALLSLSDMVVESAGRAELERSRILPERTTFLWLEGLVFTLGFQPGSSRQCGKPHFCHKHPSGYADYPCEFDYLCGSHGCRGAGAEDTTLVSFRFDVRGSQNISATLKRKWDCLLIYSRKQRKSRRSYEHFWLHWFLILDKREDETYECVGTFRLRDEQDQDEDRVEIWKANVPFSHKKIRLG